MEPLALPEQFTRRIEIQLGGDAPAFFASLFSPSPVSIRLHPVKGRLSGQGLNVPWCTLGRYLPERPRFIFDPAWHAGAYYVQEASSMFLEQAWNRILAETTPLRVLDLCGAPGGKSTHLLSMLTSDAILVANEPIQARAAILAENTARWGMAQALVTRNDAKDFARLNGFFDVLVVDAPCSGEGLFRKDTEATAQWSERHLQLCAERQRRIVADVWPSLREGGFLIYSTCTFNPAENEENLRWLADTFDARFLAWEVPKEWGVEAVVAGGINGFRFWPHRVRGEGFFIALVQKTESAAPQFKPGKIAAPSRKIQDRLRPWVGEAAGWWLQHGNRFIRLKGADPHIWAGLIANLRITQAGIPFAEEKGNDLLPLPEAAFSTDLDPGAFPAFDLGLEEAVAFLRRDAQTFTGPSGWGLARWNGLGLGWVKHLGARTNNYYPQSWRIRRPNSV